jgi:glycosyltransferase involved in cell wall biosynthesis
MLIACRLSEARGVHIAIEAANKLAQRRPELDWRLKIAGSGEPDYLASLKEKAGKNIEFLGKLDKPALLTEMKKATIAINPTIEVEGFGRTNIEAMACFTALIATDIPSIHEIVQKGESAEIVPTGDSEALSASMERLLTDAAHRKKLTQNAQRRVEDKYTFASVISVIDGRLRYAQSLHSGSKADKFPSD